MLPKTSLANKLHRVAMSSDGNKFKTRTSLAAFIANKKFVEFSYNRSGKTQFCNAERVGQYVSFAHDIGLLNDALDCIVAKNTVKSFVPFSKLVADRAMSYAETAGAKPSVLKDAVNKIVKSRFLPTTDKLYEEISTTLTKQSLRWVLLLLSHLKPKALRLFRGWLWIPSGTFDF